MSNKKFMFDVVFEIILLLAISFSIFQLICPVSRFVVGFRIDYFCLGILAILIIYKTSKTGIRKTIFLLKDFFQGNKKLAIACGVYFVWDGITILYAQDLVALLDKYLVWAKISALCFCLIFYFVLVCIDKSIRVKIDLIFLDLGMTSILISIIAYMGYYGKFFTEYDKIMTTIPDYNSFATGILFGYISIIYEIVFCKCLKFTVKLFLISLSSIICIPAIYLSGSRRGIILLFVFICWLGFYIFYKLVIKVESKNLIKNILLYVIMVLIISSICIAHIEFFKGYSTEIAKGNSANIDERIESISNGLGIRLVIWETTFEWYDELPFINKLIGGGASYHMDIFNNIDDPKNKELVEYYQIDTGTTRWMRPHNFLLEDLMAGGAVKVVIVLSILLFVLIEVVKGLISGNKSYNLLMLSLYLVLLANLMMGSQFGIFGNRYTWIFLIIDFAIKKMDDKFGNVYLK